MGGEGVFWGFFAKKKKCYPLSFPTLGRRDSTRALKSSPFPKFEILEKSQKITFFLNFFIFEREKNAEKKIKKKCYPLSFPVLGGRDSTRALQSSPFQILGGGGYPGHDREEGQRTKKEILVSYLG